MSKLNILSPAELEARKEIELENYTMKIQIESRAIGDISQNHIIPTAIGYQNRLVENIKGLKEVFEGKDVETHTSTQMKLLHEISRHITEIKNNVDAMINERRKGNKIEDVQKKAIHYCDNVKPYFEPLKYHVDKLEMLVDDEIWPLPKLREMLFTK